ncbi:hypothetical protein ACLOJK_014859, partial [Asimina triloba]
MVVGFGNPLCGWCVMDLGSVGRWLLDLELELDAVGHGGVLVAGRRWSCLLAGRWLMDLQKGRRLWAAMEAPLGGLLRKMEHRLMVLRGSAVIGAPAMKNLESLWVQSETSAAIADRDAE